MKDISLEFLYKEEYIDIEREAGYLGGFIWMDLEYWRNGQTITIKKFKVDEIALLSELEYFEAYFQKHCDKVEDFFKFINEQLEAISNRDVSTDEYKDIAMDEWNQMDDDEKEQYDDDFDNYFEEYISSSSFDEILAQDQEIRWESFREKFEDEFKIMDKAVGFRGEYFDSYGNVSIDFAERFNEEVEDIISAVDDFKESIYDANEMNNQERIEFFNNLFSQ